MANRISPSDFRCNCFTQDTEADDCQECEFFGSAVRDFHDTYAMPPEKLKSSKGFHEGILDNCFKYLGFCTDMKKIGGSYEGVKVVKSEKNDDFEFDVMFVLKIPKECLLEIREITGRHAYAMIKVANGCLGIPDYYRATGHKFFARCLTFENDMCIVDAGETTASFFGELQKWMNTKPVPGYNLRPKQHGTAIQMDVIPEQKNEYSISYSVDIAPTLEIWEGDCVKRYVVKPEKKRTPDSITWRRLFGSEENISGLEQLARRMLRSAVEELDKQLSKYCSSCKGICQGSCFIHEAARTRMPLSEEYMLKLQAHLVSRESNYRLTFVNLQELNISKPKRLVAINYFFENELEAMSVPGKPGYAWLKLRDTGSVCSRLNSTLKLCYLPGGKYLDIKAASDMLVAELQKITKDVFGDDDSVVRRDGPIVRIDVYPEKGNTMLYYCLDIVLAAYVDGSFYIGLPDDYDYVPDRMAWRRSYSYEETTKIQQAPEGLKTIFRVLKALRNGECGLSQLTSYHFKTLLLNMQQLNLVNWNDNIYRILIHVLKHLKTCLSEKELLTHFIPEINLLENMTNDCSVNIVNRIDELLRSKRKLCKILKVYVEETTRDILMEHAIELDRVFPESRSSLGSFERELFAEIEKKLFGYDYWALTSKPVYEDITVYRIFSNEVQFLTNFDAIMVISDNKNNLRVCRYNKRVVRLKRCNSTVSTSLLQTVPHSSGLADTRKTAEYITQQMEKIINKSSFLFANVRVYVEGSNIVLKSSCDLELDILPGYEIGEGFFVAMPNVADTAAWVPIPFTPVRNKFWKAFKINECGKRVLSELREICKHTLPHLSEYHIRMAIFWEMEVERDWSDDKVEERVHDVLDRLLTSIKQRTLPSYFDPTKNTLAQC